MILPEKTGEYNPTQYVRKNKRENEIICKSMSQLEKYNIPD